MNFNDKSVLVTGGTGSFGKKFIEIMLKDYQPRRLIVFSRDELKQYEMRQSGFDDSSMRYFLGDVRDVRRLRRAFLGVDYVVHAAALKQVPACEYNPIEAVETNIIGSRNIIDAALDAGVKKVVALSTDKAVAPLNLYGTTKLAAEKLLIAGNAYRSQTGAVFSCVRYGNVIGSRGSVLPLFRRQMKEGAFTITDERMTRFWLTLEQGVRFVIRALIHARGGEVFIPKIPSMKIVDLARAISPEAELKKIGIRPGEKLHETLLSEEESRNALEYDDMYLLKPSDYPWCPKDDWSGGKVLPESFLYRSDLNTQWLTVEELRKVVDAENVD